MPSDLESTDPEKLAEESRESLKKVRAMIEEHEGKTEDAEPPPFYRKD